MTDRLSALDGTFLELEDADPAAHMHIGAVLVFEGDAPTLEAVRAHLARSVGAVPRFHQRLAHPDAGALNWQRWEHDPNFDVARHVRRAALPSTGGWEELLDWAGDEFSRRLRRDIPLWEVVLIEGLADGHWALCTKTHHCLTDGVGSVDIAHLLLADVDPPDELAATPPAPVPRSAALDGPLSGARAALHAISHPAELASAGLAMAELVLRDEVRGAPDTSLNAPIGPRRVVRAVTVPLDEARAVSRALGGTVNDVALSAVTAGLRALLCARAEPLPGQGLRAMVPLNRRDVAADGATGNRISSLFIDLPVAEDDAVARYETVAARTQATKRSRLPQGADALVAATSAVPPIVHARLVRPLYAKRLFNLTVTNVRGPDQPLFAFGSRLKRVWPLVPIASDHAVAVAVFSYDGTLVFGINADADGVPDVDALAEGVARGLAELQQAVTWADDRREVMSA